MMYSNDEDIELCSIDRSIQKNTKIIKKFGKFRVQLDSVRFENLFKFDCFTVFQFGLKNFEHRLIIKLFSFIYIIYNEINSPSIYLKNMIKRNNERNNEF